MSTQGFAEHVRLAVHHGTGAHSTAEGRETRIVDEARY
jgi:hypothetical protein